jgi:hypothetical protein
VKLEHASTVKEEEEEEDQETDDDYVQEVKASPRRKTVVTKENVTPVMQTRAKKARKEESKE